MSHELVAGTMRVCRARHQGVWLSGVKLCLVQTNLYPHPWSRIDATKSNKCAEKRGGRGRGVSILQPQTKETPRSGLFSVTAPQPPKFFSIPFLRTKTFPFPSSVPPRYADLFFVSSALLANGASLIVRELVHPSIKILRLLI
ncbi:hypothetical protein ACLOJK_000124 [Asimina triloba]